MWESHREIKLKLRNIFCHSSSLTYVIRLVVYMLGGYAFTYPQYTTQTPLALAGICYIICLGRSLTTKYILIYRKQNFPFPYLSRLILGNRSAVLFTIGVAKKSRQNLIAKLTHFLRSSLKSVRGKSGHFDKRQNYKLY